MKVLGIIGSPHGKEGNTYLMVEKILEEANGARVGKRKKKVS